MSHEIFGSRFTSHRVAAWHSIGTVSENEMSAREALSQIGGDLNVRLHPNFTLIDGTLTDLPGRSIVRYPTSDDPEHVVLGQVGPDYTLITPGEIADIWDASVGKPIETMGVLRRGALFFCTTKLPTLDIKGDEVERYLGVCSPMDGQRTASAEEWDVRVVCANTLRAAQAQAKVSYRVIHDAKAKDRLGAWLLDAYQKAEQNYDVVKEAFELLASRDVSPSDALAVVRRAYPEARIPRRNAPDEMMAVRMERWERAQIRIRRRRETALELFQGDGTGMDLPAAKGTLWGLYNAITETENFRKGFAAGGVEAESARVGEDVLFGRRGEAMQRAFDACLVLANGSADSLGGDFDPSLN